MSDFWWTAIVTLATATAVGVIARRVEQRQALMFRPPASRDHNVVVVYSRCTLMTLAAGALHVAWMGLAAIPISLALVLFAGLSPRAFVSCGAVMMVAAAVHFALAALLRCDACGRRVLLQMVATAPFEERWRGLSAWGSIVTRVVFQGRFRCMACGQRYTTRSAPA